MTREEYAAHVKQNKDTKQFYKEIGEQFGKVKFLGATRREIDTKTAINAKSDQR